MATSIGRGRGRGRGINKLLAQEPQPGVTPLTKPQKPKVQETKIQQGTVNEKSIADIMKPAESMTVKELIETIVPQIDKIKSESTMEELVQCLINKSMSEPDFGIHSAQLCNEIWNNDGMHSLIRKPLFSIIQQNYTKRSELKKQQRDKFYGLCVFFCELYKLLRLKNQPLKPLVTPVCQILKELCESDSDPSGEDIFYFYQLLESVGSVIQSTSESNMDEIINLARQTVVSVPLKPSARCRLVQLIELHAANWKMANEIKTLYDDLQQDLMAEGN